MPEDAMTPVQRICRDLGLPEGDSYTQDWAYELAEEFRNESAFYRYVDAYANSGYGDPERRLLVQLALDVANDLLQEDMVVGQRAWKTLANVVRKNRALHKDQVAYWAVIGEPIEDAFALSPLARSLWQELYE